MRNTLTLKDIDHINLENIAVLATTFMLLHEEGGHDSRVNMYDATWYLCGTVACHAGWFAVARGIRQRADHLWKDGSARGGYDFFASAEDMATFLGFKGAGQLALVPLDCAHTMIGFFSAHPGVWGNSWGNQMFASRRAFGVFNDGLLTLGRIGEHWAGVYDRLYALKLKLLNERKNDMLEASWPANFGPIIEGL